MQSLLAPPDAPAELLVRDALPVADLEVGAGAELVGDYFLVICPSKFSFMSEDNRIEMTSFEPYWMLRISLCFISLWNRIRLFSDEEFIETA